MAFCDPNRHPQKSGAEAGDLPLGGAGSALTGYTRVLKCTAPERARTTYENRNEVRGAAGKTGPGCEGQTAGASSSTRGRVRFRTSHPRDQRTAPPAVCI